MWLTSNAETLKFHATWMEKIKNFFQYLQDDANYVANQII